MAALLTAVALGAGDVVAVDALRRQARAGARARRGASAGPGQLASTGTTADVVVEAAGNVRAFEAALAATAPGGRTVTVGLPHPDARASISPLALVAQAKTVIGSYLGSAVPSRDIPGLRPVVARGTAARRGARLVDDRARRPQPQRWTSSPQVARSARSSSSDRRAQRGTAPSCCSLVIS